MLSITTETSRESIWRFLIQDTGCGIPAELMSRIQEPFFTTKRNGNGLGLSICRSIIWNAGGRMEIPSQPGAGTQIRVLLPICRREGSRQDSMSSWRILVVDDEAGMLRSVERCFGQDYKVASTRSSARPLRLAQDIQAGPRHSGYSDARDGRVPVDGRVTGARS